MLDTSQGEEVLLQIYKIGKIHYTISGVLQASVLDRITMPSRVYTPILKAIAVERLLVSFPD
jgi:hypothetical protein